MAKKQFRSHSDFFLMFLGLACVILFVLTFSFGPQIGKGFGLLGQNKKNQETYAAGKGNTSTPATMTVLPNPAPLGTDTLAINGSGFSSNSLINLTVSGSFPGAEVTTDGSGKFYTSWTRWGSGFNGAGDHWVTATKPKGKNIVTLSVVHFTVCSTSPCQ